MNPSRLMLAAASAGLVVLSACAATSAPANSTPAPAPATAAPSASASAAPAGATPDLARAEATFKTVCSGCHEAELAAELRNTREGWQQLIERMFGFGLAASADEVAQITDYLVHTYPAE